eukprot:GGOE01015041.1.p1 GENE.GGOE01015041.1~~GGOE01015041.1.p1  ORF type:complete len:240 (+),score=45.02 GGOE01015041.1:38-721(+)
MAPKRVFVIRHGERLDESDPEWRLLAPRPHDPPLSDAGKHQACQLGALLRCEGITKVFSSPLLRCVQTANYIAEASGDVPVLVEPALFESNDAMRAAARRARQPVLWILGPEELYSLCPRICLAYSPLEAMPLSRTGVEYENSAVRCMRGVRKLLNQPSVQEEAIALVCHASSAAAALMVMGIDCGTHCGPPTSFTEAIRKGKRWVCCGQLHRTEHLEEEEVTSSGS